MEKRYVPVRATAEHYSISSACKEYYPNPTRKKCGIMANVLKVKMQSQLKIVIPTCVNPYKAQRCWGGKFIGSNNGKRVVAFPGCQDMSSSVQYTYGLWQSKFYGEMYSDQEFSQIGKKL